MNTDIKNKHHQIEESDKIEKLCHIFFNEDDPKDIVIAKLQQAIAKSQQDIAKSQQDISEMRKLLNEFIKNNKSKNENSSKTINQATLQQNAKNEIFIGVWFRNNGLKFFIDSVLYTFYNRTVECNIVNPLIKQVGEKQETLGYMFGRFSKDSARKYIFQVATYVALAISNAVSDLISEIKQYLKNMIDTIKFANDYI